MRRAFYLLDQGLWDLMASGTNSFWQTLTYMNAQAEPETAQAQEQKCCELCGCVGGLDVGGRYVCADCCETAGSCCAEREDD